MGPARISTATDERVGDWLGPHQLWLAKGWEAPCWLLGALSLAGKEAGWGQTPSSSMMVFTACLSTLDPQASFQAGSIGPEGGSAETWLQRSHPSRLAVHLGWALSALCTVASEAFLGCQCSPSLWGLLGGLSASSPQQSDC